MAGTKKQRESERKGGRQGKKNLKKNSQSLERGNAMYPRQRENKKYLGSSGSRFGS